MLSQKGSGMGAVGLVMLIGLSTLELVYRAL